MDGELFDKLKNFEKKYSDVLCEWLTLVKAQRDNEFWRPRNKNDLYGQWLYEASLKHDANLRNFEKQTDLNILCTYLKYHNLKRERFTYPFSFTYSEPKIDLVLNPYKQK